MPASRSAGYAGDAWSHGNWFCGFWVGLHLAAYLWTRDERHLGFAKERMVLVAPRADNPNTHDIGFIFGAARSRCSTSRAMRATHRSRYARPTGCGRG